MNVALNNIPYIVNRTDSVKHFVERCCGEVEISTVRFFVDGERLAVEDVSFADRIDDDSRIDMVFEKVSLAAPKV